jgi:CDP-glycerol glycerophosphotransferase
VGPTVSVVVEGAASLDLLAQRLPDDRGAVVQAVVVCAPDVDLPRQVGELTVARAGTLDAAVQTAGGELLVVLAPGEVPVPAAWAEMAGVLAETGSDLVVGDLRTKEARGWSGELFGHRRLRRTSTSCPLALVDLSVSNKMFRVDLWRRAGLRFGPGGVAEAGPAAMLSAYASAEAFDVLARVVAESTLDTGRLPLPDQPRFRPDVLASTLAGLRRALDVAPPGWCELVATHLLPALYLDAVGGGEPYFDVLTQGSAAIVDRMDPVRVPLAARLGAWAVRHGTLLDVALLQDLLADHPYGLPVRDGLAPVPEGMSLHPPLDWRAVQDVDRRPRARVSERAVLVGARCRIEGAAFTEYVSHTPLPEVTLLGPTGPVLLQVEVREDQRTNEWAARAFEDRSQAGWTAWFDAAVLSGRPHERWTVEVCASGHTTRHQVAGPLQQPRARTEVDSVSFAEGSLSLSGSSDEPELHATVTGVHGSTSPTAPLVAGGRFAGSVELSSLRFGEPVRLQVGGYELRLTGGDGAAVAARWSPGLLERSLELVDHRQRVTLGGDGTVPALRIRAPLRAHERGAFAQQQLLSRVYAAPGSSDAPPYGRTVLFETFRGRSAGDNPGAICRELQARRLDLDLAWVVDDPAVVVPEGTRAVVRRSREWYDVLGHARAYVANAGAPYWFEKRPDQIHLQTWHGTPLKHIGEDRGPGDFATWRHRRRINAQAARWDAMLSPGPMLSDIFRSAFRYDGALWEVGYPRNDVLLGDDAGRVRDRVRARLGLAPEDRALLYAPTWRSHLGERESKPLFLDAEEVLRSCPDVVVLVRGHYTATTESEAYGDRARIQDVTRYPDIADLYLAADVLVTDYSSVMFDFVLTDKPVVLLTPDLEQYREVERGFYFDLEEHAPGPMTRTTEGVVEALSGEDHDAARRARFRARFCPLEEGRSAAQAVDRLLELW